MGVLEQSTGQWFLHYHPLKLVSSDPASAKEGMVIVNTSSNQMKIYYSGSWQVLHTLTVNVPTVSIKKGQPIGLAGVTYAEDVN